MCAEEMNRASVVKAHSEVAENTAINTASIFITDLWVGLADKKILIVDHQNVYSDNDKLWTILLDTDTYNSISHSRSRSPLSPLPVKKVKTEGPFSYISQSMSHERQHVIAGNVVLSRNQPYIF